MVGNHQTSILKWLFELPGGYQNMGDVLIWLGKPGEESQVKSDIQKLQK